MNVWEKVNCWSAVLGAASLLVFGGYSIPRPAEEPPAPAPVVEQVSATSLPGGMTEDALIEDAWVSYEDLQVRADAEAIGVLPEYMASYQDYVPEYPADYFFVQSETEPSVMHVFRYVPFKRA